MCACCHPREAPAHGATGERLTRVEGALSRAAVCLSVPWLPEGTAAAVTASRRRAAASVRAWLAFPLALTHKSILLVRKRVCRNLRWSWCRERGIIQTTHSQSFYPVSSAVHCSVPNSPFILVRLQRREGWVQPDRTDSCRDPLLVLVLLRPHRCFYPLHIRLRTRAIRGSTRRNLNA